MLVDSLIIGNGQVGSSLEEALCKKSKKQIILAIDAKDENFEENLRDIRCKSLHICFPYSKDFVRDTIRYISVTYPSLCIIHSSIAVGTTKKILKEEEGKLYVVHSPVRGQHPVLTESLLYFIKYIGTDSKPAFDAAKKEMSNFKVEWIKNPDATELGKLLDTSYYGICISWHREMKRLCKEFKVDYEEVVTRMNKTYNLGYKKFRPNVIRPVLSPPVGKIGGHCVVQNARMLEKQAKSKFLSLIK